ncbi:hypothetical protein [Streptomyces halstedii]|uniref:hypothetical protein n=1 Tax=Streptomyces halstedii TaxID=1944 RepID=UPI0038200F42
MTTGITGEGGIGPRNGPGSGARDGLWAPEDAPGRDGASSGPETGRREPRHGRCASGPATVRAAGRGG